MRRTVLTRIRPVLDWLFRKKINHTSIYFENGRTGRCMGAAMSSAHSAKESEASTVLLLLRLEDAKEMGATDTKRFPWFHHTQVGAGAPTVQSFAPQLFHQVSLISPFAKASQLVSLLLLLPTSHEFIPPGSQRDSFKIKS